MVTKVLFYLLDGESNASSRHRVLQYFPELREHGIEPFVSRPVPEPLYQRLVEREGRAERLHPPPSALEHSLGGVTGSVTRSAERAHRGVAGATGSLTPGAERADRRRLASKAAFYSLFLALRTLDVLRADAFDVVVIQRDLFPFGPPWLERLLAHRNPRLVYDTDDATYLRPVFTPNTPFQKLRRFDKVAEVVARAAWVSAATPAIAEWARRYNANVSVVPMAVDLAEYDRARAIAFHRPAGPLVLGWAGTAGGLGYLKRMGAVLAEICAANDVVVRIVSGGYRELCLPGVRLDARPWHSATGLADMAAFDIGLVPLDDTPFEQAKFPFKLLQYLALGVPAISARVGIATSVIRHGENGLLADSPDAWRDALETLIADARLRRTLAAAGRETVEASYTLERVGPLLVDGLRRAAS
jgi:glycosyltransferase involved in cell wall biosynthesis